MQVPDQSAIERTDREVEETLDPFGGEQFSDERVNDVVSNLRDLHRSTDAEFLPRRELFLELDLLFTRNTFRLEALRDCSDQRWGDRLDAAFQVLKVLRCYERNVQRNAPDKHGLYRNLLKEVGDYCAQMSQLLFLSNVNYDVVKEHIGKATFKANLPKDIEFPTGVDKLPIISDDVNNPIEEPRLRAIDLMNQITDQ